MHDNIKKTYKKCNNDKTKTIKLKEKKMASKLKLEDWIQILDDHDAYIFIKNHKEGFPDKISCCLINPSKSDIGKISKQILDFSNTNYSGWITNCSTLKKNSSILESKYMGKKAW